MKPLDDWMELELWEPQRVEVQLALPEGVDRTKDESAVFIVKTVGVDGEKRVSPGDIVMMHGGLSVVMVSLPNRKKVIVGRAQDVAFIMENADLKGD